MTDSPQTVYDLETPSVLIDLDRMERNLHRMQDHCDALGLAFRPHIKTHKIPAIAQMQIDAGAAGIACQKVSEAEVFAQAGFNDIQIPYNILGERKTRRLAELAIYNRVTVSADHPAVVHGLSQAAEAIDAPIRVMVELGTEKQRTGTSIEDGIELAKMIEADDRLHFAGLLIYPSDPSVRPILQEVIAALNASGIGIDSISGGGTGAALHAAEVPELTELRVGTYIFNDWTTVRAGWCALEDCAMTVRATVVSRPTPERAILDAGSKTLTPETIEGGYGHILEYPQARIYKLNEEHGYVDLRDCEDIPDVGEIVHIVPVHTCVVTNMHDMIYGLRGEQIEVAWPVAARGKVW